MSAFIYRFSTTWDLSDLSRDLPKATLPSPSKLETSIPAFKSTHFHPLPSSYRPHIDELTLNQPTKILLSLCQQELFLCRNLDRSPQFNRFRLFYSSIISTRVKFSISRSAPNLYIQFWFSDCSDSFCEVFNDRCSSSEPLLYFPALNFFILSHFPSWTAIVHFFLPTHIVNSGRIGSF